MPKLFSKIVYFFLVSFITFTATAYEAHFVCYSAGAGVNVGEYRLGSIEVGNCYQLGWFSVETKPSLKLFINHPHRSSAILLSQFFSAQLTSFLLIYSTNANYVELAGRYYGMTNVQTFPFNPIFGPAFGLGSFQRWQEEDDDSTTKHKVSIFSLGVAFQSPILLQKAALEIQKI